MNLAVRSILNKWQEFTLTNKHGMAVSILDYGGIITKIIVPDRNGHLENVVLGYKNHQDYETNPNYFGALIGRVAGRIQGAAFELDGKTYELPANNGENHLHGGPDGFHQVVWDVATFQTEDTVGLKLSHKSEDGAGSYPGNAEITVTYTLNNDNQLILDYSATSDQTTPLTLTNHAYFNLSGNLKKIVDEHHVTIDSSRFVELDKDLIPTGNLLPVAGTPFDFRNGRFLGDGFNPDFEQNRVAGNGYDHYFIFDHAQETNATVTEPSSGRILSVKTNQPGMVMYTSNGLADNLPLAEGDSKKYHGVCLETQASPASLHHKGFPGVLLKAGEQYEKQTVFTFSSIAP